MCKGTGRRPPPVSANTRWPLLRWAAAMWSKSSGPRDRKSTRLNSSHLVISYAVFCLKKKRESVKLAGISAFNFFEPLLLIQTRVRFFSDMEYILSLQSIGPKARPLFNFFFGFKRTNGDTPLFPKRPYCV